MSYSCNSYSFFLLYLECDNNGVCPDINNNYCPVCQNGGSCQDVIDGYSCQCMLGYTGVHCEANINECQGVDCKVSHNRFFAFHLTVCQQCCGQTTLDPASSHSHSPSNFS